MSVYVIMNVDVKDPAAYEEFKTRVPALIHKYGGEYLVRGGKFVIIEGGWKPSRLVVVRLPDISSAQALYNDPEYQPLKALRQRVARMDIVAVEGS